MSAGPGRQTHMRQTAHTDTHLFATDTQMHIAFPLLGPIPPSTSHQLACRLMLRCVKKEARPLSITAALHTGGGEPSPLLVVPPCLL